MRNGIIAIVVLVLAYLIFFTGGGDGTDDGKTNETTPGGVPIVGADGEGPDWDDAASGPGGESDEPDEGGRPVPANADENTPVRPVPAVGGIEALEEEIRGTRSPEKDAARLRLADAYRVAGRTGDADRLYREIVAASGPLAPTAAAALLDSADGEARAEHAAAVLRGGEDTPGYAKAMVVQGEELASRSEEAAQLEGWRLLSEAYFSRPEESWRSQIRPTLDRLSQKWLLSPRPCSIATTYTVERGDYLARIAQDHGVTVGQIQMLNERDSELIHPGDRLKILDREVAVVVDKSEYRLDVTYDGAYLMSFPVGHGAHGRTPVAEFVVDLRQEQPNWYPANQPMVPYGDPGNPLGERWIGFGETNGLKGFGIHGTNQPETIGSEASEGCVRLRNEDVIRLYPFISVGCKVSVVE